jgi:hypothetical protein
MVSHVQRLSLMYNGHLLLPERYARCPVWLKTAAGRLPCNQATPETAVRLLAVRSFHTLPYAQVNRSKLGQYFKASSSAPIPYTLWVVKRQAVSNMADHRASWLMLRRKKRIDSINLISSQIEPISVYCVRFRADIRESLFG